MIHGVSLRGIIYFFTRKGFKMANIPVAYNIQAATVAGFVAVCLLHVCQANGIIIPPDVADALPGVLLSQS